MKERLQLYNSINGSRKLRLKGENPSRRAPTFDAARTIQLLNEPLEKVISEERLGEIQGIKELKKNGPIEWPDKESCQGRRD